MRVVRLRGRRVQLLRSRADLLRCRLRRTGTPPDAARSGPTLSANPAGAADACRPDGPVSGDSPPRVLLAQSSAGVGVGTPDEGWPREIVTHHGSPAPPTGDLVAGGATAMPRDDASPAEPPGPAMTQCHWCGRCCLLPLRRGFLRRCDHRRGRVGHPGRSANRHGDRD